MTDTKEYEKLLQLLQEDLILVERINNPLNKRMRKIGLNKKESDFMEYSVIERVLYRNKNVDRVIPIENTVLNELNIETGNNVETIQVHYGPYADELTRSLHTLALTVGADIYFRSKAYKPETEEGRKVLAHELTHVQQSKEDRLEGQRPVVELEKEAEDAEKKVEYNPNNYREIEYKGKKYKVSIKQYKEIMSEIKNKVEYITEHNTLGLDEEEYLKFLIAYNNMESNGEMLWQK